MSKLVDVSIILPVLEPGNDFRRCLCSIRAALKGQVTYTVICVVRDLNAFHEYSGSDITFVKEDVPGIYGAMNKGIREAQGLFLYFIGQDDILLPAAAKAVIQGIENRADLILADVFWGDGGVFKNNSSRNYLVWKNWCHQGVFYNRLKFISSVSAYPVQFKVQADHYANIVLGSISGLKKYKYNRCIAWYSSDGFSSRVVDAEFRAAFPALVLKHYGVITFSVVVVRRILLKVFRLNRKAK